MLIITCASLFQRSTTNHSPHYYVKDEVLRTGVRLHANVVMDFLTGQI